MVPKVLPLECLPWERDFVCVYKSFDGSLSRNCLLTEINVLFLCVDL